MFTLGIDPGLSRCGYGVITRDKKEKTFEVVSAGVLTTPKDAPLPERLFDLSQTLKKIMTDFSPGVVVVERVLFQVNAKTAMSVGQASGLALVAAAELGIEVYQYSSNEVKQAIVGYGGATKVQMQKMVAKLLGLEELPGPFDVADAIGLAMCHATSANLRLLVGEMGKSVTR